MPDRDSVRLRELLTAAANRNRDVADEMAAMFDGCDDPLHPYGPQVFRDYVDFVDRVARPLVDADGDHAATQAAMALFRKVSPYYLCTSMVMMANRLADTGPSREFVGEVLADCISVDLTDDDLERTTAAMLALFGATDA